MSRSNGTVTMSNAKIAGISSLGGGLEMYDFTIYMFFAPMIAALFFPPQDHIAAILSTYGIFAVGYLARPIGAVLFGHFGDRIGRKQGLVVTFFLMGLATTLMGFVPTYAHIGVWAPIILVVLRLLQGVAVGGDLPGAITFVAEHAEKNKRGIHTAWVYFGVNVGILVASGLSTLITNVFSHAQVVSFGWRIGFIFSLLLLVVGFHFRLKLADSPIYGQLQKENAIAKFPLTELVKGGALWRVLQGVGVVWLFAVVIAQIFLYMPSYLNEKAHLTLDYALLYNTINIVLFSCSIPVFGFLSDKVGRKKVLFGSALFFLILSYPLYWMIAEGSLPVLLTGLFLLGIFSASIVGVAPATLAELFRTHFRYTGVGIAYNIGFAIFAGLTPFFVTWLMYITGNPISLAYNLMLAGVLALVALGFMKERSQVHLSEVF